jgi:ASC-1-like (ASCH) protein
MEMKNYAVDKSKPSMVINNPNPWFDLILTGKKTIEGRLNKGLYQLLKPQQSLRFRDRPNDRIMQVVIKGIRKYDSFRDYIQSEGLDKVAPHLQTIEEAVTTYKKFYKEANPDIKYGVLAIEIGDPKLIE